MKYLAIGLLLATWALLEFGPSTRAPENAGPVSIGGEFTLTDVTGKTISSELFRGQLMLVFFGYTHCPDICPVAVSTMAKVKEALGDSSSQVAAIFITVDPERDTSEVMKGFLSSFNGKVVGLTGSPEAVKQVAAAYRIFVSSHRGEKTTGGDYAVDHSTIIYMMGRRGEYLRHFSHDAGEADITAALLEELRK